MFRIEIPAYDIVVVRELVVNALVHRPYTTRGDIFINLTPDNMEIKNPGRFPLGITVQNILVKSVQRNPNFSKIFYDLQLMEKEGSGYDIMFKRLLTEGKSIPHVFEGDDFVSVKIERKFKNAELVHFMNKASLFYELNQKEKICLGIIVQNESISSIELSKKLSIKDSDTLYAYLKKLLKNNLIELQGKTKGATYTVTPTIFKQIKFQTHATLKTIEPYRLKELIFQDLKRYGSASFSEIQNRIGKEISKKKIRAQLAELIEKDKTVKKDGDRRWTKYIFIKKN